MHSEKLTGKSLPAGNFMLLFLACMSLSLNAQVWSNEKAGQWYASYKWITGVNYIPATAINQLEMWQAGTFDTVTINRELGWAEMTGFNTLRVFLHSLAWQQDAAGFKQRMAQFLQIANRHHLQTIFVFFDDCWNGQPKAGTQPAPKPGVHNSGWVQDPGDPHYKEPARYPVLQSYVRDILSSFAHDKRIIMWDLYNEPGNQGKNEQSLPLLQQIFAWARAVGPDQPLTAGLWSWRLESINRFIVANSDILTYHNYEEPQAHAKVLHILKSFGKPLICTEYMARTHNSRFNNILPLLKKENTGAINWGFVSGKTNTIYSWEEKLPDGREPDEWFHDIFRSNGTPYRQDEVHLIKQLNAQ